VLAFAHHVPDVAEHEQIAGDRARQARDIVGISGHQPGGEALCKMRRRIFFCDGIAHPPRQFFADGNVLLPGEIGKAVGEIGVVCGERHLDILSDDRLVVPQGRIELDVGEFHWVVLCRQNGAGVACMGPQQRAGYRAHRHTSQSRTEPPPFHPENPSNFALLKWCAAFKTQLPRRKKGFSGTTSGTTRLCRICISR
jgi:hypothetical protein